MMSRWLILLCGALMLPPAMATTAQAQGPSALGYGYYNPGRYSVNPYDLGIDQSGVRGYRTYPYTRYGVDPGFDRAYADPYGFDAYGYDPYGYNRYRGDDYSSAYRGYPYFAGHEDGYRYYRSDDAYGNYYSENWWQDNDDVADAYEDYRDDLEDYYDDYRDGLEDYYDD